ILGDVEEGPAPVSRPQANKQTQVMDFGSLFEGEEAADSATEVVGEEQAGSDESEEPAVRPGVRRPTADEIALQQARDNAGLGEETPKYRLLKLQNLRKTCQRFLPALDR